MPALAAPRGQAVRRITDHGRTRCRRAAERVKARPAPGAEAGSAAAASAPAAVLAAPSAAAIAAAAAAVAAPAHARGSSGAAKQARAARPPEQRPTPIDVGARLQSDGSVCARRAFALGALLTSARTLALSCRGQMQTTAPSLVPRRQAKIKSERLTRARAGRPSRSTRRCGAACTCRARGPSACPRTTSRSAAAARCRRCRRCRARRRRAPHPRAPCCQQAAAARPRPPPRPARLLAQARRARQRRWPRRRPQPARRARRCPRRARRPPACRTRRRCRRRQARRPWPPQRRAASARRTGRGRRSRARPPLPWTWRTPEQPAARDRRQGPAGPRTGRRPACRPVRQAVRSRARTAGLPPRSRRPRSCRQTWARSRGRRLLSRASTRRPAAAQPLRARLRRQSRALANRRRRGLPPRRRPATARPPRTLHWAGRRPSCSLLLRPARWQARPWARRAQPHPQAQRRRPPRPHQRRGLRQTRQQRERPSAAARVGRRRSVWRGTARAPRPRPPRRARSAAAA